jgi:hypothetical protein
MGTTFGGSANLPSAETHTAVCVGVIDLGHHEETWDGVTKTKPKILLQFELVDENMDDGRPFMTSRTFTNTAGDNGALKPFLEAWRGKPFTPAEMGRFDIATLLGVPCLLGVIHETKAGGKTYANIKSIQRLPKGTQPPGETHNRPVHWSTDMGTIPGDLPDWVIRKIMASAEYAAGKLKAERVPEPRDGEAAHVTTVNSVAASSAGDEDIPF